MLFDLGGEIKSYKREKKRAMREKLVHGTRGRKRKREWVFLLWYFFYDLDIHLDVECWNLCTHLVFTFGNNVSHALR